MRGYTPSNVDVVFIHPYLSVLVCELSACIVHNVDVVLYTPTFRDLCELSECIIQNVDVVLYTPTFRDVCEQVHVSHRMWTKTERVHPSFFMVPLIRCLTSNRRTEAIQPILVDRILKTSYLTGNVRNADRNIYHIIRFIFSLIYCFALFSYPVFFFLFRGLLVAALRFVTYIWNVHCNLNFELTFFIFSEVFWKVILHLFFLLILYRNYYLNTEVFYLSLSYWKCNADLECIPYVMCGK